MSDQMSVLVTVLAIGVLIVVMFYVPRLLVKRAVRKVVAQFRERGAISPETATTLAELGLVQDSFYNRVFRLRNYRPYAVRMLGQAELLRATEEGTVYFSEEAFEHSPVKKFARME